MRLIAASTLVLLSAVAAFPQPPTSSPQIQAPQIKAPQTSAPASVQQKPVEARAFLTPSTTPKNSQGPAADRRKTIGDERDLLFWSVSREFAEKWVRDVPATNALRRARLSAMLTQDDCAPAEQPVGKSGSNLVCTMPGDDPGTVLVAAQYRVNDSGKGAIENWSGAAMLPLLVHAMRAAGRHFTYVFVALDGPAGAQAFLHERRGRPPIRAMFTLNHLGLGPTRSCAFPDSSLRFLRDLGLEVSISQVGKTLGGPAIPERESCFDAIKDAAKTDDTLPFRKAGTPAVVIHSVTRQQRQVPGSSLDTPAAIDAAEYYGSYQLVATYLCALDRHLDDVLADAGPVFDPFAAPSRAEIMNRNGIDLAPPPDPAPTEAGNDAKAPVPPR